MPSDAQDAAELGSVKTLSVALDARDAYTQEHCDRVVHLALELGDACAIAGVDLNRLRFCAQFHDVGKIGVPDAVLLKPGRLNAEEWDLMKAHSAIGERILRASRRTEHDAVATAIRHHHESYDGSGYPDGLAGDGIPLICRVMLVVDAYDAMTTTRPYHQARSHAQTMDVLRSEGGRKIDPRVLETFAAVIERSAMRAR